VGVVLLIVLTGFGLWFASKKDDYNPAERDISIEVMKNDAVVDTLYRTPLQRWRDPSADGTEKNGAPVYQLGPFPASILEGGWEPSTRLQRFDESNLFEKINGAAPQYFQYGFRELIYLSIRNPESEQEINIELYDMGSLPNAIGIFAAQRDDDQELTELGPAHYFPTPAGALGVIGSYYFKLTGNSNSAALQKKAVQIVRVLGDMDVNAPEIPQIYQVFSERLKIPFARITYEKSDVFQYDFAHDFWFARPESDSDLRYYVHEADSAENAQALFAELYKNHLYDYSSASENQGCAVLKHNYLGSFMALCRKLNVVFGVEGAPDPATVEKTLEHLEKALFDEEEN